MGDEEHQASIGDYHTRTYKPISPAYTHPPRVSFSRLLWSMNYEGEFTYHVILFTEHGCQHH